MYGMRKQAVTSVQEKNDEEDGQKQCCPLGNGSYLFRASVAAFDTVYHVDGRTILRVMIVVVRESVAVMDRTSVVAPRYRRECTAFKFRLILFSRWRFRADC